MVKNVSANAGDKGSIPGVGKIPWRRKWQPTPVSLPGKSQGQRRLMGHSPWGSQDLDTIERLNNNSSNPDLDASSKLKNTPVLALTK